MPIAKIMAALLLSSPLTSGRFLVLDIFASCSGSKSMLSVFADAIVRNVPDVRKASVSVLNDGAAVTELLKTVGTG